VKGWKMIYQASRNLKQVGEAVLISDKAGLKPKLSKRQKEGHYILIKGMIHQEDIMILSIHTLNVNAHNFI
jgi:hypothetical protein